MRLLWHEEQQCWEQQWCSRQELSVHWACACTSASGCAVCTPGAPECIIFHAAMGDGDAAGVLPVFCVLCCVLLAMPVNPQKGNMVVWVAPRGKTLGYC